jgi:uncharacterized membrane protein YcaP (DUF421 family)
MQEFLHIFWELLIGYLVLLIMIKVLGKTQISQITTFDFISALVLGDLLSNAVFDSEAGLIKIVSSIVIWGSLIYVTEIISQKSRKVRKIVEGVPSILIDKGKLNWQELKKNHLDLDQLMQLLHKKEIFSLREVEYALLENDGTVSVKRKARYESPTYEVLGIQIQESHLPVTLISDGEIILENLKRFQLNEDWLYKQIQKQKISRIKDICYAEWNEEEGLHE